jgi:hypothetical protein
MLPEQQPVAGMAVSTSLARHFAARGQFNNLRKRQNLGISSQSSRRLVAYILH